MSDDLAKKLQRMHEAVTDIVLDKLEARKAVYETIIDDEGNAVSIKTDKTESAASRDDLMMAMALLKQNEIKAELKQQGTFGKLRDKLENRKRKRLPRPEEDE